MTLPLFEKSSQLVEKSRPMSSNLWFLPQTVSRLLLLCRIISGLPMPKIFQQNGIVTGGHRIKTIKQPVSSSRIRKQQDAEVLQI